MAQNSSRKKAPARKSSLMGLILGGRKAKGGEAKAREEKERRASKARNSSKRQWIGNTYLDGFDRISPAFLNSTGLM